MDNGIIALYIQLAILIGGSLFAWINFIKVIYKKCEACGTGGKAFDSKCFTGAIFFTLALALNIVALLLITD